MRLNQNGLIGVLLEDGGVRVSNVLVTAQQDDPCNPVAIGYATVVEAVDGLGWSITGPNLLVNGTGRQSVSLPPGDYEVTVDTA